MEWKDTTSYSRGDTERKPTTFSAQCGPIRLVVTNGHIYSPGVWISHAYPLFESRELTATTREEAQEEAIGMARAWLAAAEAGLSA